MKLKQAIWLGLGVLMITSGDPLQLNALDLLGYFLIAYIFTKHYFGINLVKVLIKQFSI